MKVITMSRTELSRLRVMIDLADGRTRVEDAAALMGLQRRQVYRLLDAFPARAQHRHPVRPTRPKGRVERAHKTLQDRLVKELRLAGANDIAAGNALLPAFMADYNRRFAKPARNDKDLHRPLAPQDDLDGSFAWRVERTVTQSLTVQYDRVMFILEPNDITRALPRKKVTVYDFPDGRIEARHQGLALPYRTFDRITRVDQGAIVENKRLSEALEMCRKMQAELPPKLRSRKAPARTAQAQHMFARG